MESDKDKSKRAVHAPSLFDALLPICLLIGLIGCAIALYKDSAMDGPVPAGLVLCTMVASLIAIKNGHPWAELQASAQRSLSSVTTVVFILLGVGALIGTWNLSGTIPTLVSYGMRALSRQWFYPSTAIICGAVALCVGSAWTTAGTVGVAALLPGKVRPEGPVVAVLSGRNIDMDLHLRIVCGDWRDETERAA